jgi:NADH-quinone oxidoreductase subunit K
MSEVVLFYLFSAGAVLASAFVIGQRNPMHSVLLLVLSFAMISGLYVLLDAPFIAVTQIIVYAGALMVLFIFVVMLLKAPTENGCWRGCCAGCGELGTGHRTRVVSRLRLCLRGDVSPHSRGARRRRVPGPSRGRTLIPLGHYLIVSAFLFAIGTAGVFLRRNLITMLLSIEIMLNAVNLTFVAFGRFRGDVDGQIITFFVMTVAAAEAAVGLAIVIALFRHRESLNPDAFRALKW